MCVDLSKDTAKIIVEMVDSGLICYKHYYLWCDSIIESLENPPVWILELSVTKNSVSAREIISEYAYSDLETLSPDYYIKYNNFHLACLYLRYKNNEISWYTFLLKSGYYSDCCFNCKIDCTLFYEMLNIYENSMQSVDLRNEQLNEIEKILSDEINELMEIYKVFQSYYSKYINH
ncbi:MULTISPECIES: hypothetical protein [Bacillaceae]|uniref:hypothetical protein n=1 Tax=Bacillaceae TaxID=186817 RepID=UPI000BF6863E|nr:hypothetical protein [Bacillus sp. AFS088145]PFH81134.1 hypothetical protein COI44_23415 [Bacillus sp. AFS088145]